MCDKILDNYLNNEIRLVLLKDWLFGKADIDLQCTPQEFVVYFISFIRNESSRYVQTSTAPIPKPELIETPKQIIPRRPKSSHNYSANSSYDRNSSIQTSTPKRRNYRSIGSDTSINESQDSVKSRSNHSYEIRHHTTLENYFTEQLFSNSKENISLNRKKKKNFRNSQSPKLNNTTPVENIKTCETKRIDLNVSEPIKNIINVTNNKGRRIKPTILSEQSPKTTIIGSNSFSFTDNINSENNESVANWHRSILREERERIAAKTADVLVSTTRVPPVPSIGQNTQANPLLVTQVPVLTRLAALYSLLIDLGLLLSPVSELHLLLTLLLTNSQSEDIENQPRILVSLHNCVWLASRVLWHQRSLILVLNRVTLRLLSENLRLKEFAPDLIDIITEHIADRQRRRSDSSSTAVQEFAPEQTTFMSDTDSRDNFSTENSFRTFRKQRDGFYTVLQIWEQNHGRPGWVFAQALGAKIRAILDLHHDIVNYCHLARLFVNQLLGSSNHKNDFDKDVNLLDVSSDKLNKLKNRLINKETPDTQAETDFPHQQEFYRDFINCSRSNQAFIKYLENTLADGIVTTEEGFYQEEVDGTLDSASQDYVQFLKSTRLQAKFLGYIEALPYKSDVQPKEAVMKALLSVRKQELPILDVEKRLNIATKNGWSGLLLTIPWVAEYLGQLDCITLQLPSYERVIKLLFQIQLASTVSFNQTGSLLVRMCLGTLFETSNFPRHLFYANILEQPPLLSIGGPVVDERALYECVPRLLGLRALLSTGAAPLCIRYIRPVTAASTNSQLNKIREQKQLEDVFFHGHPESVKRLVEFAAERIASAILKMIKRYIEIAVDEATEQLQEYVEEHRPADLKEYETFLRGAMQVARTLAEEKLTKLKDRCCLDVKEVANNRSERSIPALLPDDIHPVAAVTCVSIAARKASERVMNWVDQTLTIAHIMDPLTKELSKTQEDVKTKQQIQLEHFENIEKYSTVKLLTENKELIWKIHDSPELITSEAVTEALEFTKSVCLNRKELAAHIRSMINLQICDFAIALCMSLPDMTTEQLPLLVQCLDITRELPVLRGKNKDKDRSVRLINVRNIMLISEGPGGAKSWAAYKVLLLALLKEGLITGKNFQEEVFKLFQINFPEVTFNKMTVNLKDLVDDYISTTGSKDMANVIACLTNFLVEDLP